MRGIDQWSPHKRPVIRNVFTRHDVISTYIISFSIIVFPKATVFGPASYLPSYPVSKRISNIKTYFSDCFVELFPCDLLIQTGMFTNPRDWGFPGNSFHSPPRGPWSIPVAPYYRKPPNCARGIYHYEYTPQLQMHWCSRPLMAAGATHVSQTFIAIKFRTPNACPPLRPSAV